MPSAVPSYHSLDPVEEDVDAAELPVLTEEIVVQQPGGGVQSSESSSSVITILFQFITHQSYIGMLIIMMVTLCIILFCEFATFSSSRCLLIVANVY